MRTVMILGNCVAERLQTILQGSTVLQGAWEVVPAPMIHRVSAGPELDALAARAARCDLVFSQPLFHYGACNTEELRKVVLPQRLALFSAPNFEAYFPDVLHVPSATALGETQHFPPPLEWHSRIILGCFAAGVPAADVEMLYVRHALFRAGAVEEALDRAWAQYARREQGVELGTLEVVREHYTQTPLFHTWNHPGDEILRHLCAAMLCRLGCPSCMDMQEATDTAAALCAGQGFGFNQWPIITRHHREFAFAERAHFTIAGQTVSIGDAAEGYYNYYRFHPAVLEAGLRMVRG